MGKQELRELARLYRELQKAEPVSAEFIGGARAERILGVALQTYSALCSERDPKKRGQYLRFLGVCFSELLTVCE